MYFKKTIRHKFLILTFITLLFLCCNTSSYAQADFYVKEKPPCPTCDGLTWATAFDNLQAALDVANSDDEIWIAQGTYYPSKDATGNASPIDNQDKTFYLDKDLKIFGGFPNVGNPTMDERDWEIYPSILNGDLGTDDASGLSGEDLFTHSTRQDNAYTVLQTVNLSSACIVDGLRIQNGNASGAAPNFNSPKRSGGGMHNDNCSLNIQNCIFSENSVDIYGGGIFDITCNLTVEGLEFSNNWTNSGAGGGMFEEASDSKVENCIFSNNAASGAAGGFFSVLGNPTLSKCIFTGNSGSTGGGIAIVDSDGSTIVNSTFINNVVTSTGGGLACLSNSSIVTVTNCTFFNNSSLSTVAGAIEAGNGVLITNCIVWGNTSYLDLHIIGNATVNHSIIEGGWTGTGSNNLDQDPLFLAPINNDLRLSDTSPAIEAGDNSADLDGNGIGVETIADVPFDLDGNVRIIDFDENATATVDMGAYEAGEVSVDVSSFQEIQKILANDSQNNNRFGISVSISGNYAIVGASDEDTGGIDVGAAYIFQKNVGIYDNWIFVKKIQASDKEEFDRFGVNVSIIGNYAVVGATFEDTGGDNAGAAYIFQKDYGGVDNWGEIKKIQASDKEQGAFFGISVSIFDNYVIVGASREDTGGDNVGAAYIFQKDYGGIGNWGEIKKIQASDKEQDDLFGISVSIYNNHAIVGAFAEGTVPNQINEGAAYIFQKDYGGIDNWGEIKKIKANDKDEFDYFGSSVSIHNDYAIVGAFGEGIGGAAYIIQKDYGGDDNWGEVKKIQASDKEQDDLFGLSVSIHDDYAIVGADGEDTGGNNAGAAYIFQKDRGGTNNWGEVKKIQASDKETDDYFGTSVSISGNYAIVGAEGEDTGENGAGAVYIFKGDIECNVTPIVSGNLEYCTSEESTLLDAGNWSSYLWSNGETSQTISAITGIYTITVTNESGCIGTDEVEVTENTNPNPTISGNLEYCATEDSTILDAGNWSSYLWSNGATSQTITATEGTYSVEITDSNGCSGISDEVSVVENESLNPSISGDVEYCASEGSTVLDAGNWSSYLWSNGGTNQTIAATEGTYNVEVTDSNGCSGISDEVSVVENESLNPSISGNVEYCVSVGSTVLDAGNWSSYLWSNGATSQTIAATEGTYSVEVTDSNGCSGVSDEVNAVENENITPTITGNLEYCATESSTILDAGNWSSYLWSNGETTQTIAATEGTYNVEVTDSNGCSGISDEVSVVENESLNPSISGNLEYCATESNTILDAGNWSSYLWSNGGTNQTIAATEGTYNVEATDSNGCSGTSDAVTVAENNSLTPIITGSLEYCGSEGNTILDAGNWSSYLWSNGGTNQTIAATEGTYSVEVTDSNGCSGVSDEVTMVENENPSPFITSNSDGSTTILDAGNWSSYLWSNGETTQTIVANTGTYNVEVTDSNGCSGTAVDVTIGGGGIDLELNISSNKMQFNLYENITYTIAVTNKGGIPATGVKVMSTVPSGMAFTSKTTSKGNYNLWAGIWTVGTLNPGETATLQMVLFTLNNSGSISNFAQVTAANEADSDSTPNNMGSIPAEDDEGVAVIVPVGSTNNQIDLALSKTANVGLAKAGDVVTYKLTVVNNGTVAATGVTVEDMLPSNLTFTGATATKGTYNDGTGIWDIGTIAVGANVKLTIHTTVDVIVLPMTNFAQVKTANENDVDSTPDNNSGTSPQEDDEDSVLILPDLSDNFVDIELTTNFDGNFGSPGQSQSLFITVKNKGPADAVGVTVAYNIPSEYNPIESLPSKGTTTLNGWTVGNLASGETANIIYNGTVGLFTEPILFFAQIQTASPEDSDSTPGNDTDQVPDEDDEDEAVLFLAGSDKIDLETTITSSVPSLNIWTNVTFTLDVTNTGSKAATGVKFAFPVPTGMAFTSKTTTKGNYNLWAQEWTIGTLQPNETAILDLTLFVLNQSNDLTFYGEIIAANEDDLDSTPANGNGFSAIEDDEAAVIVLANGSGGGKIDLNANIVGRSALLTVNRIYPIPTNDVVNIIFTSKTENVDMILYDFSGRVVYEQTLEVVEGENATQIDLTSFPVGWYFVSMETEDGSVRAKMVKQ